MRETVRARGVRPTTPRRMITPRPSMPGIEFAVAHGRGITGAALDAFELAFPQVTDGPDREFVRALLPYMLNRRA
jgi:hypothetical protein